MKILFISDYYPPYIKGGAEVSTSLLASWFSGCGNTVSVACSRFVDKSWNENGVTVYPIILKPVFDSRNLILAIIYGFKTILFQLASAARVLKLIRSLSPDVINIVPPSYRFILIIIAVRFFYRGPIVVDCRDTGFVCPSYLSPKKEFNEEVQTHHGYRCIRYAVGGDFTGWDRRLLAICESVIFNLYKSLLRFLVNHSDQIKLAAVSKYVQQQLVLSGFKEEKTTNIYNISQPFEGNCSDQNTIPTFAYAGRLEKDKGVWDLMDAVGILRGKLKQSFAVKVAGVGEEFDHLKKIIEANDFANVTLLGHIKPAEVIDLYTRSSVVVGPSRAPEAFGRFILEAISVRKPIIATRSGGIPEGVENGVTGVLVDVGDAEQLAEAMKFFIEKPERASLMSPAIVKAGEKYRADVIGKQRMELYKKLKG
ncbi:MAG: glycosyltransferase family 4 protein [Patescibacteria group bacterium]